MSSEAIVALVVIALVAEATHPAAAERLVRAARTASSEADAVEAVGVPSRRC